MSIYTCTYVHKYIFLHIHMQFSDTPLPPLPPHQPRYRHVRIPCRPFPSKCNTVQQIATCCNTLQHTVARTATQNTVPTLFPLQISLLSCISCGNQSACVCAHVCVCLCTHDVYVWVCARTRGRLCARVCVCSGCVYVSECMHLNQLFM